MRCFNPFSFRSPSKPRRRLARPSFYVSIPSPSGLLQNYTGAGLWLTEAFQSLLLQVSFKTITGFRWELDLRFNPFSFRSPSKREGRCTPARLQFQSLLLQVSFKTESIQSLPEGRTFQSLLLQVSFKTARARNYPLFRYLQPRLPIFSSVQKLIRVQRAFIQAPAEPTRTGDACRPRSRTASASNRSPGSALAAAHSTLPENRRPRASRSDSSAPRAAADRC